MELFSEDTIVRINIVGVGGGGTNAVERMVAERIPLVQYITINTDDASVRESSADMKLQIGKNTTKGWGAGGDPEVGYLSAQEDAAHIKNAIKDCDMLFIVAGMGGGTGTGAAPVVAQIAHELGILTVGVVTKPFYFEGKRRIERAESGISKIEQLVDSLIVIPNDNLKCVSKEKITFNNALAIADGVLVQTVKNIVKVIQQTAVINCDFADISSILRNSGRMYTASGTAVGVECVDTVIGQIISSKLLGTSVDNADGALLYITTPGSVGLDEIERISNAVSGRMLQDANIIFGIDFNENQDHSIKAVLIATHHA